MQLLRRGNTGLTEVEGCRAGFLRENFDLRNQDRYETHESMQDHQTQTRERLRGVNALSNERETHRIRARDSAGRPVRQWSPAQYTVERTSLGRRIRKKPSDEANLIYKDYLQEVRTSEAQHAPDLTDLSSDLRDHRRVLENRREHHRSTGQSDSKSPGLPAQPTSKSSSIPAGSERREGQADPRYNRRVQDDRARNCVPRTKPSSEEVLQYWAERR